MSRNLLILSIRGEGIFHNVWKYIIFPLVLALGPVVLLNTRIVEADLSRTFLFFVAILILIVIGTLVLELVAVLWMRLKLTKDGLVEARVVDASGRFRRLSFNVSDAAKLSLSPGPGAPLYLFRSDGSILASWGTQFFGTTNMRAFIKAAHEANPFLTHDDHTEEFMDEGGFTTIEKNLLRAMTPLLLGVLTVFYVPMIELICIERHIGEFNWMQETIQDLFYFTLAPFLGAFFVWFIARLVEERLPDGSKRRDAMQVCAAIGIIAFLSFGGIMHYKLYKDFFGRPQALYEQRTRGVIYPLRTEEWALVHFGLENLPALGWSIFIPAERIDEVEREIRYPLTVIYLKELGTLIKAENTYTHELLYRRADPNYDATFSLSHIDPAKWIKGIF